MSKPAHFRPADLRGLSRVVIDAVCGVTDVVEAVHHTVARPPALFGESANGRTRGITGLVYRSIRGVTGLVGGTLDTVFAGLVPIFGERSSSPERELALAMLNGVVGDYLVDSGNPMAIPMTLRRDGQVLILDSRALAAAIPKPSGKLLVAVHGLCRNDRHWIPPESKQPADPDATARYAIPERLARELGYTPLYLHYNSGRHISTNGREFAGLLERLVDQWPVPVEEIAILGHSMGGLVTRSACYYGARAGHRWPSLLNKLVFLGTPHHGAPLERGGARLHLLLGVSAYSAPFARLGRIRSAGITDLRHGNLLDDDWAGRDRFGDTTDRRVPVPLPRGVDCHAVAATTGTHTGLPGGRVLGDGLVPVDSALGRHDDPVRSLSIAPDRQWVGHGMNHLNLLSRPVVYERLKHWLVRT